MAIKSTTIAAEPSSRLLFIDNLRTGLITLVVLHHVALVYGAAHPFYYFEPPFNYRARVVFGLFPEGLRPEKRRKFKAYDGVNNAFNLAYTMLKWRVHRAILGAKLEPYLGFDHSEQFGKPSLVCDLMELYRYLVDDFLIGFCGKLGKRDFVVKGERTTRRRWGKREYLNHSKTRELDRGFDGLFEGMVDIPRIKHGSRQTLETLINEEALLLAKYLRDEKKTWIPRIAQ